MRSLLSAIIVLLFISCGKKESAIVPRKIVKVEIESLLKDSLLSIRAIEILEDNNLAFAANNSSYGMMNSVTKEWKISKKNIDTFNVNFRSVAHTKEDFLMLGIASPTYLYKTTMSGMKLFYSEDHPKAFYDAMDFWNDQEGIAMGDPTDKCISIIITRDGGNSWNKISCEDLQKSIDGEAAFAASDTNIAIVGDHTWIATGGNASRVMYSPDKGHTWEVFETPIIQGTGTTGMYSIDFYDELNGFAIGGDYTKPKDNSANKIRTVDGGKTWDIVGANQNPDYRSCVQYIPNREGKELVVIGFNGIDYSNDSGSTWTHLSDEGFYTLRFIDEHTAYAAGKGRISKLTFKE